MLSVSATIPWPANDASPWIRIGSATPGSWTPACVERSVCSARVRPSTTGSTASRWLGLAQSVTVISPDSVVADALGAEVVLDVAGAALGIGDDRLDRPLALELAQDRLVGLPDRVGEHAEPAAVRHPDHDLVRARLGGERDRLVEHRHHHVEALDRELLLAEEGPAKVALEALDLGEPLEQAPLLVGGQAAGGTGPTRSPGAARRGARGRRCARSRRRSSRSRCRAAAGARRRASRPGRRGGAATRGSAPGARASAGGSSRSGSSAGSPTGSEPSGSRRAARWPCMRYALTSAIAAATPPSSSSSDDAGVGAGAAGGAGAAEARRQPCRPLPSAAASARAAARVREVRRAMSPPPASNRARHSSGTDSGFSRYCSRSVARVPGVQAVDVGHRSLLYRAHPCRIASEERPLGDDGDRPCRAARHCGDDDRDLRRDARCRPPIPAAISARMTAARPTLIGRIWKCVARDAQVEVGDRSTPRKIAVADISPPIVSRRPRSCS